MLASKSPFESYKSKQILFCTYLICPPVSCPIFNFSEKLQNIFEMGSKKNRVKKKIEKNWKWKICAHSFDVSKFEFKWTNFL